MTGSQRPLRGLATRLGISLLLSAITAGAAQRAAAQDPPAVAWRGAPPLEAPADVLAAAARAVALPGNSDADPGSPDADPVPDVMILSRSTAVRFDDAGRRTEVEHLIYQVRTAEGVANWATVSAEWSPWFEDRPEIRARVIDSDDRPHQLDTDSLHSLPLAEGDPAMVGDTRLLIATLPAITIGAVVETLIERREHRPFFIAGTTRRHYLVSTAPMAEAIFRLEAPATAPLRYRLHLAGEPLSAGHPTEDWAVEALAPQEQVVDGHRVVQMRHASMPAAAAVEPGQTSERARWPSVSYATADSWNAVAHMYAVRVDEAIADGARLDPTQVDDEAPDSVATLMAELPPSDGLVISERIDDLLAVLHAHTRASGRPVGKTPMRPAAPHDVIERGLADGQDLATLLVAMLRHDGIPAFVALIDAGTGHDVDPELPGLGLFNHALVQVPGLRPLWIDPSDPHARAGELAHTHQDRWALIAAASTQALVKTPATTANDNRQVERREVYLPSDGPGRVIEVTDFYGAFARQQRSLLTNSSLSDRRQRYARYVETTYVDATLGTIEELGDAEKQGPVTLRLEAVSTGRAATELDQAVVGIPLADFVTGMPDDFFVTTRKSRVHDYVHLPFGKTWHYRIHPPAGFTSRSLPPSDTLALGAATLRRSFRIEDGVMLADFGFDSGPRRKTAAQFDATRRALVKLTREEPVLVLWFDPDGTRLLHQGQTSEAIRVFATRAAAPAAAAADHVRLGRALLSLGLVAAARSEAERAVLVAPESSLAHWFHGLTYVHDPVGRPWRPGADRGRAVAALEKAVALDPDHELAQAELLLALERGDDGRRLGTGVDLTRAARHIVSFRARFGNARADSNLAEILLHAQDGEALLTLAESLEIDAERAVWKMVGAALVGGSEAVRDRVLPLTTTPATRASYLAQAAQKLMLVGRYQSAAAVLRMAVSTSLEGNDAAGESGARNSTVAGGHAGEDDASESAVGELDWGERDGGDAATAGLIAYANALDATRPLDQVPEPADAGRRLLHRLLRWLGGEPIELESIFHSRLLSEAAQDGSIDAIARRARDRFVAGPANQSLPENVVLDLAYRFITLERHSGQGGLERLEVRASVPGLVAAPSAGPAGASSSQTILAAPDSPTMSSRTLDPDTLRIIGFGNDRGNAGLMVRRLLEDGEAATARQWLDWVRLDWIRPDGVRLDRVRLDRPQHQVGDDPAGPGTNFSSPFIGHPFPRVWPGDGPPTVPRMHDAAAVLMALSEDDDLIDEAVSTLVAAVERLDPMDTPWPALAGTLYRAHLRRDDVTARGELTGRMLEAFPDSTIAFERRIGWLLTTGAYAEARALATRRLDSRSSDQLARRVLAQVATVRRDTAAAHRWFSTLAADAAENAGAFNQQAWLSLFTPAPSDSSHSESGSGRSALALAAHAADLAGYRPDSPVGPGAGSAAATSPILHTLASAYAAADRPSEAYRTLIHAIEARGGPIDHEDFLVLGRIAATVGQIEWARRYFQQVEAAPAGMAFSTRELADRWLDALDDR